MHFPGRVRGVGVIPDAFEGWKNCIGAVDHDHSGDPNRIDIKVLSFSLNCDRFCILFALLPKVLHIIGLHCVLLNNIIPDQSCCNKNNR